MRSYVYYISLLLFTCFGIASCTEHEIEEMDDSQYLELTVSCVNLNATRAEDATDKKKGEDDFNENLIKTLHYFLYPIGEQTDGNTEAVLSGKIVLDQNTKDRAIIRIPMNETTLNTVVFPRPQNRCKVYLIANLPEGMISEDTNTSINNLKSLGITTDFQNNLPQDAFIMDGEAEAAIINRNKTVAAQGTILLDRLAAKFTVRISVADSFTDTADGNKVWTPQVDQMKIHLDNAVANTTLNGTFGDVHFDYAQRYRIGTKTETKDNNTNTLYVFAPFYSYPCQWEYLDEDALVMYIMLPWGYNDENGKIAYKNCFYKVYPSTMQFDRNSWYNMDLHIGVLGSFTQTEEPIEIKDYTYKVVDWKNGFPEWEAGLDMNADLLSTHYLIVEQNEYVVNNKDYFEIPFITSHPCIIKDYDSNKDGNAANDFKVTKKIFIKNSNPVNEDQDITTQARTGNWITIEGNTIKLNHKLNNDFINTNTYDYTPYVFTFYICHKDNPEKFQEKITIIQKPAISVTAYKNSYDNPGEKNCGYVFVNGNAPGDYKNGNLPDYGGVKGRNASGNNSNPYMYTVEVSVLPAGSKYILGDPRVKYSLGTDIANSTMFYSAPSVNGDGNRSLANYYGTSKDVSTENMIAPKFRICSAHGWCSDDFVTYEDAFNRAASYQEDGYPAGRWRVPTKAEISFVHKLYTDTFIPPLFYGTYAYWSATGRTKNNNPNDKTGDSPLRCVYDEWYWEQSKWPRLTNYSIFTWGDEVPANTN